ncbi:MAG TPA: hypothetical protein HA230_04690 [Candidatus Aenigmarchaeota archaeon]|nr:hypothetical protein [Candidatus Aenigmarchaeota archaeon]
MSNHPVAIAGRGFREFERMRSGGSIVPGDVIFFSRYADSFGRRRKETHYAAVTDSCFLDIIGNPYDLVNRRDCGSMGYKFALVRAPWYAFKKKQLPDLLKIHPKERKRLYL